MPQYKLLYFNVKGRAELARLIFAYAGQKYEDVRYTIEEFAEIKPTMPFLQLPVLEVDGTQLTQSHSIARFLARRFKIAGRNNLEAAQADAYVDLVYELMDGMTASFYETDPEKKKELGQKFMTEELGPKLRTVEKQLKANGSHYLVGDSLTWADIAFYGYLSALGEFMGPLVYTKCIHLKVLVDRVGLVPNIKKYVETRPKNQY